MPYRKQKRLNKYRNNFYNKKKQIMPKVPFPHILTTPRGSNENLFRVVQPNSLKEGDHVYEPDSTKWNEKTQQEEMLFHDYRVTDISETRPARGDWSKWDNHPLYFKGKANYKGLIFDSERVAN